MREGAETSLVRGLACSVGLHALLGLTFAWWGDGPVGNRRAPDADPAALLTYLPPPEPAPIPEPTPRVPEADSPPPPEPDPLRLGVDESTANTPAWLGFTDPTEHNAPKAEVDQSAMELEPGRPGPPAPPGPSPMETQSPAPPAPPDPPEAAAPQGAVAPSSRVPEPSSPPVVVPSPPEAAAPEPPAPLADEARLLREAVELRPEVRSPDRTAPPPELDVPEGDPSLPGEPPADEGALTPGADVETTGEARPPEQAEVIPAATPVRVTVVEIGPNPIDSEADVEVAESVPEPPSPVMDASRPLGPPVPETLDLTSPEAREQVAQQAAPPPTAEARAESSPPGAGGNDGRPGEKADRESDPASMKPIRLDRWTLGRVMAGEGVNVRTTRPRWTTTTLLTATAPKDPVVRVTFGRNGKVVEADFVNGQGSGYDNVDEPLLNAVHSWTASGRRIRELPANDPDAGLTIVFMITLR